MNYQEALRLKPRCRYALSAVLQSGKVGGYIDADGNKTGKEHGSASPRLDSKATIICKKKFRGKDGYCHVIDDSDCPEGLK